MSWPEIRAEIAKAFVGLKTESPAVTILKANVFERPPSTLSGNGPYVVIYPPKRAPVSRSHGARTVHYTVTCMVLARDAQLETAGELIDALAEAALDPFDEMAAMNGVGNAWLIGQTIEAPRGDLKYAGTSFVGFDCILVIGETQAKELSP